MGVEEIVAIAGLALSAAGAGTSIAASNAQKDDMNKAMQDQLNAQKGFQKKGKDLFQQSADQSGPGAAKQQITSGEQQAQDLYKQLQAIPLSNSQSTSEPTQNKNVDSQAVNQYSQLIGKPNAALQGLTSYDVAQWIKNLQAGTRLGVNSAESASRAQTLPYMLQGAQMSGAGLQGIGSLLGTVGGLASSYGAVNGGLNSHTPTSPYSTHPVNLTTTPVNPNGLSWNMNVPGF